MPDRICTGYIDSDGIDIGCHLVTKEYVLENYPELVPWMKAPALWLWGSNTVGQVADNTTSNRSSPVQTVSGGTNWKTFSGGLTPLAIKTDGTLWAWGSNSSGQLGNNTTANASSPVQTVSGGTNWKQVSAGTFVSAAIKTDGTLWLWGSNSSGQLGNNTIVNRSSPVQTVSGGTNWKQVSLGTSHSVAIKTDGTLWLWGAGTSGALGTNTTTSRSSPVQTISGGTNWKQADAGNAISAAIKTDGTLWTWGSGACGALGDGTAIAKSSPIQTISGGADWKQVKANTSNIIAIKTDGTLWLWGAGTSGALGTNTTTNRSSPVQTVSGGRNWKDAVINSSTAFGLKTDGTLWAWGSNGTGGLGLNRDAITGDISSPVQMLSGGTSWKLVSARGGIVDEGEY